MRRYGRKSSFARRARSCPRLGLQRSKPRTQCPHRPSWTAPSPSGVLRSLQTCQHHPPEVRLAGSGYRPRGQGPTHRTHLPADPDAAAGVLEPPRHLRPTAGAWGRGAPVWQQSRPVVLLASPRAPVAPPSRPSCRCRGERPRRALAPPLLSTLHSAPLAESAALRSNAGASLRHHSLAPLLAASRAAAAARSPTSGR